MTNILLLMKGGNMDKIGNINPLRTFNPDNPDNSDLKDKLPCDSVQLSSQEIDFLQKAKKQDILMGFKKYTSFSAFALGSLVINSAVFNLLSSNGVNLSPGTLLPSIFSGPFIMAYEEDLVGLGRKLGNFLGKLAGETAKKLNLLKPNNIEDLKYRDIKIEKPTELKENEDTKQVSTKKPLGFLERHSKFLKNLYLDVNNKIGASALPVAIDFSTLINENLFSVPVKVSPELGKKVTTPFESINEERLINNFIKLAGINGVHGNEDKIKDEIKNQITNMGYTFQEDNGGNIIVKLKGEVEDAPAILFCAHTDTVTPTTPSSIKVEHGRIFTDESHILGSDDRSGIAIILEVLKTIKESKMKSGDIIAVFTVGEEGGLIGSFALKPEEFIHKKTLGFVFDSFKPENLYLKGAHSFLMRKAVPYTHLNFSPIVRVAFESLRDANLRPKAINAPPLPGALCDASAPALTNKLIDSIPFGTGMNNVHTKLENIKMSDIASAGRAALLITENTLAYKINDNNEICLR